MEGTPFGRYRLLDQVGKGGMGEVWRAHDTETNRIVAVKLLPPQLALDAEFQERFRREARAAAGINDPHVVPIHNFGEIDGRLYVDMRLIQGADLQDVVRPGAVAPERAVVIIEHIAAALNAAHRIGLVHRDVKPSNILVTEFDFAYLIDFGIASAAGESGLTGTGTTVGTLAYMAPERFSTGHCDARADVYALACVLHQCLTGQRPYPGNGFEHLAAAHMWMPAPRPSAVRPDLPVGFDEVISRGMAKNPDDRYQTALDLARAARAALTPPAGRPPAPRWQPAPGPLVASRSHQSRRRWLTIAGIGAVLLVALGTTIAVVRTGDDEAATASGLRPSTTGTSTPTQSAPTNTTPTNTMTVRTPPSSRPPGSLSIPECTDASAASVHLVTATNPDEARAAADDFARFNPPPRVRDLVEALVAKGGNLDYADPQTNETIGGINDWIARVCPLS